MALSFAEVPGARSISGTIRETFYDITLDSSYPTGGETIAPGDVGLDVIFGLEVVGQGLASGLAATSAYDFKWDPYTGKLQAFAASPSGTISAPTFTGTPLGAHVHDLLVIGGQAAAGTDTVQAAVGDVIFGKEEAGNAIIAGADSATEGGVIAVSAGTPAGTISAPTFTGSAGALAEVANGTNLSTIKIRARVVGV